MKSSYYPESWVTHPSTVAGAGAGLVSSVVTCPLDVIKTRLQAQRLTRGKVGYLNVFGTVRHIWQTNGFKGYYRGLGPTILGYIPTWAIYFSLYDGIKNHFGHTYNAPGISKDPQHSVSDSMALHLTAAATAGASSTLITHPIWVVKTRFMTQPPQEARFKHTLDAFIRIYRAEGITSFYRGLVPSLIGVSHVVVQFPLYDGLKLLIAERRHVPTSDIGALNIFLCSAVSKMSASIVTYPHEVVRTRLQVDYAPSFAGLRTPGQAAVHPLSLRAITRTCRAILEEKGWRGMYRGLSVNLLRTVPNSAITLLTYEHIMLQLHDHRPDEQREE